VSESITGNESERSADPYLPPIFTKLATKVETPEDVITYCFLWKSERRMSAKPEVELIFTIAPMKNSFNIKYLENGDRYHDGVNGSRI